MATDIPTLRLRLAEAELARHKLQTGSLEVELIKGDRTVKFSLLGVNGADKLAAYIEELKRQLVAAGDMPSSELPRRRPLNVLFGA